MTTEGNVLLHLEQGNFMEAVSAWRDLASEKGYFGSTSDSPWGLSARLLEGRLLYLTLISSDERYQEFLERYRVWLLDQTSHIAATTTLSFERLALPDSMRVGHPEIDRDHEALFAYANDIRDSLRHNDRIQAAKLADGLIDEILAHFEREEKVMFQVGYPDASAHSNYHTILRSKAEEVRKTLLGMLSDDRHSVVTFDMLISFLVNDPISADMDFKAFFRNRALGNTVTPKHALPGSTLNPAPRPG